MESLLTGSGDSYRYGFSAVDPPLQTGSPSGRSSTDLLHDWPRGSRYVSSTDFEPHGLGVCMDKHYRIGGHCGRCVPLHHAMNTIGQWYQFFASPFASEYLSVWYSAESKEKELTSVNLGEL
ncbi:hypothetical protein PENSUB_10858 [Penicillium subrubescens]|uniref:Uncharacterized protein n=1 Tax=Penicillium subrubescens TaxID=1316194 RepID=A0A1Q5UQK8_9EURO|nr:hypothetical protein PENSUB_10858 [Penicillium subrubescens]